MTRLLLVIALFFATSSAALASHVAATGNEEPICRNDPNVFFCENYEDRPVGSGSASFGGHKFKSNGWSVSTQSGTLAVQTTHKFDGTKAFQGTVPAGQPSGGFMDTGTGFPGRRTTYWRWYTRWETNYYWSDIATKHMEEVVNGTTPVGNFMFVGSQGRKQPVQTWLGGNMDPRALQGFYFLPNMNGSFPEFTPGQWYCLEMRTTFNQGATAQNGYFQGWIDGVQRWEYPNAHLFSKLGDNPLSTGMFLSLFWNGGDTIGHGGVPSQHAMIRYHDNFIGSTARIGCLGSPPPPTQTPPPSAPSNLRISLLHYLWLMLAPVLT